MGRTRRQLLGALGASAVVSGAGCLGGDGDSGSAEAATESATTDSGASTDSGAMTGADGTAAAGVTTEVVAEGFTSPVGTEVAPGTGRRFVVDQPGRIYEVLDDGARTYFDLGDRVVDVAGYSERGLLGLAFHPDFASNGRLFVRYSAPNREGTPSEFSHTFVLAEYEVDPGAGQVSPGRNAERALLEIPQPQSNHNAGAVLFGPDGLLYVATGDGGGGGDRGLGHVDDWYGARPGGNGQDVTENLLGSVLRIDVDREGDDRPYGVPEDNPLVGVEGLDEQFAWGFRNPWRLSFVELADGPALVAADVGQGAWEELDVVRAGGNYGWNVREGAHCYEAEDCPTETPDGDPLIDPVYEYPHEAESGPSGIAVIGGHRVPDDGVPALAGRYVFADWRAGGRLFVADPGGEDWPVEVVEVEGGRERLPLVLGFGRDGSDLYVCTSAEGQVTGATGALQRLVPGS